jgi:hypothetical protein
VRRTDDELVEAILEACGDPPPHAGTIVRETIQWARDPPLLVVAITERPRSRKDVKVGGPGVQTDIKAFWAARKAWWTMRLFSAKRPTLYDGGRFYQIAGCYYEAVGGGDPEAWVVKSACRRIFRLHSK